MTGIIPRLERLVGRAHVLAGDAVPEALLHDEGLGETPVAPLAVVRPGSTADVAGILRLADELGIPVVARGAGTGLAGGCLPVAGGIVAAFDRMDRVVEVDLDNQVAVVQPGVTLERLADALSGTGLTYPVAPGEQGATLGGTIATNAGGMRAVRYGVTRHHVLGLEAVLAGGQVVRTGGKLAKSSSGYDLTQLLVGSEGTLALITEATLKLSPDLPLRATLLAPFASLPTATSVVPGLLASGVAPLVLEYLDAVTLAGVVEAAGLDLGVPPSVLEGAAAHLVVVLHGTHADRLESDVADTAQRLGDGGALDVYVLPASSGTRLIAARERAFWSAMAAGADEIVDTVVPRAAVAGYLGTVADLASAHGAFVAGCGHVGDGNVHLSVFQPDVARRDRFLDATYQAAVAAGGAVSGEHGIGTLKQRHWLALEDPVRLELQRRIKAAFDPKGILGPGRQVEIGSAPGGPA